MQAKTTEYVAVIGIEVHVQLLTQSKIFSGEPTAYGAAPNTQVSPVTLAHPGTLPVLNKKAVEFAVRMGLACHSEITRSLIFDRKNYFYPDLPKGYQITQDRTPVCKGGYIEIRLKDGTPGSVALNRIHLEEDAGKSMHIEGEDDTLIDFNRAGVPLIEIVTEPVMHSSEEVYALLTEIRKLVRYLEICDGNMEEGSMRCDANVSIMKTGTTVFGPKVEIKNMNSIRNVQRAIDNEVSRQVHLRESGEAIVSETRMFDADTGSTFAMRTKEELNDYRYFPDPDLSPVELTDQWLTSIRTSMPALPQELLKKFVAVYGISEYDARVITDSKESARYFEQVCEHTTNFKAVANWMMGPVRSYVNEVTLAASEFPLPAVTLAGLIQLIDEGEISFTAASQHVFPELLKNPGKTALEVAQQLNVMQDSSADSLMPIIEEVVRTYPDKVSEYLKGKKGLKSMFMGEVMKRSKGKADPKLADQLLTRKLQEL